MDKQLFIPDKISVGFQDRDDTYTKKLAYVIYYDQKGVRRKEKSWESWRDKKIPSVDFENTSTEGFVLNKGVGGGRQSYGWNARNEYIRVYDPRDFEFEISVANLLFILRECDCSRGKGLEGKFVYAWNGTELVLLPEISTDYQNSKKYTQLQVCGVKAKELIPGASYTTKKQVVLTYLGRFDYYYITYGYKEEKNHSVCKKQYIFWDGKKFVVLDSLKSIAVLNSDTITSDYAELVDRYNKSIYGSKIVKLFLEDKKTNKKNNNYYEDDWFIQNQDGSYTEYRSCYGYGQDKTKIEYIQSLHDISIALDGTYLYVNDYATAYPPGKQNQRHFAYDKMRGWIEPTNSCLWALLESGTKVRITNGVFEQGE